MRLLRSFTAVLAVVILAWWSSPVAAQVGPAFAQLNGTVLAASGGVIAKAAVTLREVDTNRTYTAVSNDTGYYVVPNVLPGSYELSVESSGLAKYVQTGITLSVGQTATIDVRMKVAAVRETVQVTTEVPPVEPTRSEISQVIDSKQIASLPISGRLFTDFALLTPGVATGRTSLQSTFTEFEVTHISFGGMRDFSNMFTVDGSDAVNTVTGSQRATPSQEAVNEFRVVNNSFGAEYGRALGGIVNVVTKSGTNDWHGSVYEYLRNNVFDSRSLLQPSPTADALRQNQFGGTLGGPIRKDRTFFFLNYEGERRGESPTYPNSLRNDLNLINQAKEAMFIAPEDLNVLKTKNTDNGFVRVDHQINSNERMMLRYNIFDARELNLLVGDTLDGGGIGAPSSGHNGFIRDQSLVGSLNSAIKPELVNSVLLQYGRRHYTFPGVTGQPNLDIPNSLLFGHNFGTFDQVNESRFQISDSLSWVKGSHLAKFGFDYNYVNDYVVWPGFTPMRIILPGMNCLVQFANFVNNTGIVENPADGPCPLPPFMNGTPIVFWGSPFGPGTIPPGFVPPTIPTTWENAYLPSETNNFVAAFNHSYTGFFAQDQWRINPKLTFNYGLRWDFESGLYRQINADYRGFQPRVGLAYSPDSKTVIRAGFGIFDDRYNLTFLFVTFPQKPAIFTGIPGVREDANSAPYTLNQFPFGLPVPGYPTPADAAKNLVLTGVVPPTYQDPTTNPLAPVTTVGIDGVDPNSRIPYAEQASLQIDREIGKGLVIGVAYLFVGAHNLVRARNLNVCPMGGLNNQPPPQGIASRATTCPAAGAPPPDWPAGKDNFSGPDYPIGLIYYTDNSGNSAYNGGTISITEKAGKYFHLNANYTYSKTLDDGTFTTFVSTPQDLYDRALERANSNQDIRHRFVADFVAYGPQNTFLRNFELSSIINMQSSRPFTMFVGFDANGDTNPVTDRVGTQRRNTYWGDTLYSWDVRLSRYFKFKEHQQIALMMDVFNVFNRQNVNEVFSVYGTWNFCNGQVPNQYGDSTSVAIQQGQVGNCPLGGPPFPSSQFGTPRTMFNPRQFQFALKYSF